MDISIPSLWRNKIFLLYTFHVWQRKRSWRKYTKASIPCLILHWMCITSTVSNIQTSSIPARALYFWMTFPPSNLWKWRLHFLMEWMSQRFLMPRSLWLGKRRLDLESLLLKHPLVIQSKPMERKELCAISLSVLNTMMQRIGFLPSKNMPDTILM